MTHKLTFSNGTFVEIHNYTVHTYLPGGIRVVAAPRDDQRETAQRLGYGEDIRAMTRDHDPLHTVVAALLGMPCSNSLRIAAGIDVGTDAKRLAELEETAVIALQTYMRAVGRSVPELQLYKPLVSK